MASAFHGVGVAFDFLVAEEVGAGAGGDDEEVVVHAPAVLQIDAACGGVDAAHFALAEAGVRAAVEQFAEGVADVGGRHEAGGHLVNQRREEVVVVFVDEGDAVVCASGEFAGEVHAGKAAADDDGVFHGCSLWGGKRLLRIIGIWQRRGWKNGMRPSATRV